MKLYELPKHKNIKLYFDDKVIIFGHVDGMYSYCWLEENRNKIVHLHCCTRLEEYKEGYKIIEESREK